MVRIKVVKASQVIFIALLVIAVIAVIIVGAFALSGTGSASPPPQTPPPGTSQPPGTVPPRGAIVPGIEYSSANPDELGAAVPDESDVAASGEADIATSGEADIVASGETDVDILMGTPVAAAQAVRASRAKTDYEVTSPYDSLEDKLSGVPDDEITLVLLDYDYENEDIIDIEIVKNEAQENEVAEEDTKPQAAENTLEETAKTEETANTEEAPNVEEAANEADTAPQTSAEAQVLIYHTHSREAYEQNPDKPQYVETGSWRTSDQRFSVMRVGELLKDELEAAGVSVIHDTTDHEPPKHGTSYTRSLATIETYHKEKPSLQVFIDLHRDGYVDGQKGVNTVNIDGVEMAKLMFLVGNGEGSADSGGFAIKPDWKENYKLASALTDAINSAAPGLCRPVMVSTGRYNQHVTTSCLLVEVGNNKNTLEEALAAMPYLAEAIKEVLGPT